MTEKTQMQANVANQQAQIISQVLATIKAQIETLEVINFAALDFPINGVASDIRGFYDKVLGIEKRHQEFVAKMNAPATPMTPPVVDNSGPTNVPDNVVEFPNRPVEDHQDEGVESGPNQEA